MVELREVYGSDALDCRFSVGSDRRPAIPIGICTDLIRDRSCTLKFCGIGGRICIMTTIIPNAVATRVSFFIIMRYARGKLLPRQKVERHVYMDNWFRPLDNRICWDI